MDIFTDEPVSSPEDVIAQATKKVKLPGLVVRIRRLPNAMVQLLDEQAEDSAARLEQAKKWAEVALVEPKMSFGDRNGSPHWDDLGMAQQMLLATAIAEFTTEGSAEVAAMMATFRGRQPEGQEGGPAGGGPPAYLPDGSGVEASQGDGPDPPVGPVPAV